MIEKIANRLYRIEIPLPGNPLKSLNSYVITDDRALIIDTGFNLDACYNEILKGLRELGVELKKAEIFVTHLHADHMGLAGRLGCKVNISWIDAEIAIRYFIHPEHWKELGEFYIKNGFPADEAIKVTKIHPAVKYSSNILQPNFLSDGDTLEFGGYMLEALHTPGHTPGHLCLYDEEKGILFSGDHILFDITPNITYWDSMDNALERYLKSLEKIYELEVTITLPGHRSFHGNHRKRIEEIKQHHQKRLKETLDAVKNGSRTAWEVAQKITWDMKYNSWHELPTMQKWFAVGETIAHLLYLEKKGEIRREEAEKILYYPP